MYFINKNNNCCKLICNNIMFLSLILCILIIKLKNYAFNLL